MTGIVTESLSCMTRQDCENLMVRLMPLTYVAGGVPHQDVIAENRPCPADSYSIAPSAASYYKVFGEYIARGHNVICITTSARISSSYANAMVASKAYPAGRIAVVDSRSVAGALHLLAITARELDRSGAGFTDIVQILLSKRDMLATSFSMNSISTIRDAKRLSRIMHTGAKPILNQKPICVIENGCIVYKKSVAGVFGEIRELCRVHTSPRRMTVHYGSRDALTSELVRMLRSRYPSAQILLRPITMSLRVNLGERIIGVVSDNV